MSSVFSSAYDRRHVIAGSGGSGGVAAKTGGLHCRYYATDRKRNRYSTFSIMKWFRRSKHCDGDEDSAWFRDDLQRIQQAYVEQEADYAVVTPIAAHRRTAATWSRWSGSTTTVYSFAYVDGGRREDDEQLRQQQQNGRGGLEENATKENEDDDDLVEYIDAATLPVARRRFDRGAHCSSSNHDTAIRKSPATILNRNSAVGMTTGTRRRNKRVAPLPPPPSFPVLTTTVGPSRSSAVVETAKTMTTTQRRSVTMTRKKYRAPPPPIAVAVESRPQQQYATGHRGVPHRRKKGPAPKPPVKQQQQQHQKQQPQKLPTKWATGELKSAADGDPGGSNVRRKISQYEKDRLMQRVDKIEKHFFEKNPVGTSVAVTVARGEKAMEKSTSSSRGHGFTSAATLYTAMAVTNLTELDRRAAEICDRRNRLIGTVAADLPATDLSQRPAMIAADHKNAIVTAVIRKSYPSTVAVAPDVKQPLMFSQLTTGTTDTITRGHGDTGGTTVDDEIQLVRHKRLAFFEQQTRVVHERQQLSERVGEPEEKELPSSGLMAGAVVPVKQSLETQTSGSVIGAKTSKSTGGDGKFSSGTADSKNLPCEENNCYQQLMAMEMQSDLVLHNGPFECTVCLCTYDNNGVVLRDCLHVFCRPCLKLTIDHSKAEQVVCPYIDEKYSCTGVLQHREIKKILNSDEEYERFLQRSVERARQLLVKDRNGGSFQCRRPDCNGWCLIYDINEVVEFKCPVCGTVTCVRCGSIHTQGLKCKTIEESSDSDMSNTLENLIDRGDAMICPGCNTVLSKQQGCDWIKCTVCFMEICWATKGPRWGPKGKGDITGGCMCGIPAGRKCHTDCRYCH